MEIYIYLKGPGKKLYMTNKKLEDGKDHCGKCEWDYEYLASIKKEEELEEFLLNILTETMTVNYLESVVSEIKNAYPKEEDNLERTKEKVLREGHFIYSEIIKDLEEGDYSKYSLKNNKEKEELLKICKTVKKELIMAFSNSME